MVHVDAEVLAKHLSLFRHERGGGVCDFLLGLLRLCLLHAFGNLLVVQGHSHERRDGRGLGEGAARVSPEPRDDALVEEVARQPIDARHVQLRAVLQEPQPPALVRASNERQTRENPSEGDVRVRGDLRPELAHGRELRGLPVWALDALRG